MARIRTIKPEFFTSLTVASLPVDARLTFIGLWTHCDDEGRCVDDARLIKAAVWPLDDRLSTDVELDLKRLSESSLILRYKVGERSYLTVRGWSEHQRINRPTRSKLPAPPPAETAGQDGSDGRDDPPPPAKTPKSQGERDTSMSTHGDITDDSHKERNREQGTGNREVAPPAPRSAVATIQPATADQLLGEWIEHCRRRPPNAVIGQVGKQLKQMLGEGIDSSDIRRGLAAWHTKGLHPSVLPSVVNELMNAPAGRAGSRKASTTDERVNAALALAAQYDAQEVA